MLEILVSSVLLLILGTLLVEVLVPTLRASTRGGVKVELQELALITLDKVLQDFGQTAPAGVCVAAYSPDSTALTLQPLSQVMASGDQTYSDHLIAYSWSRGDGRVVRRTWPPGPGAPSQPLSVSTPIQLTAAQVAAIGSTPNGTERVLATGATAFTIDTGPGPGLSQPLMVHLVLERSINPPERYEITRQLVLRNTN